MFDTQVFLSAMFGWPLAKGAILTVLLSMSVMGVGLGVSMMTVNLAASRVRVVRWGMAFYIWLFRGAPALLVLLFIWNGLPILFPSFRGPWFTPFLAAFIALTLIGIAYLTEVMRGAFASIGRGQAEAGLALGLHSWQVFLVIELPQALRVAMPTLSNEFISLLKTTSLATIISLRELMTETQFAISASFRFLEWYLAALIYYLAMVSFLTIIQSRIEQAQSRGYR